MWVAYFCTRTVVSCKFFRECRLTQSRRHLNSKELRESSYRRRQQFDLEFLSYFPPSPTMSRQKLALSFLSVGVAFVVLMLKIEFPSCVSRERPYITIQDLTLLAMVL